MAEYPLSDFEQLWDPDDESCVPTDEDHARQQRLDQALRPAPAWETMRWRVRLYCGHVQELSRRACVTDVWSAVGYSRQCWTCMGEKVVIAARAIGLEGEPP